MEAAIFDEWLGGTGTDILILTSTSLCAPLSTADQLGLHVELRSSGALSSFVLTLNHSQDGFRWFPKYRNTSTGAAIPQITMTWSGTPGTSAADLFWSEAWPAPPTMRFVQLQLQYTGAGARIKVFNTSRKRTTRRRNAEEKCGPCRAAGEFPAHLRVLKSLSPAEIATLRRVGSSGGATTLQRLRELGGDTVSRLDRALHMAAMQVLAGKD
jgi:hypothetical protein